MFKGLIMFNCNKELNQIVDNKIKEEQKFDNTSFAERMADRVAQFGGSWKFILCSILFFTVWIIINTYCSFLMFDKFPYILLNLMLSFFAILQAPFILMSQNRISNIDRIRDEKEYRMNLIEELELRSLIKKVDYLIEYVNKKSSS
jgi:uncharacterized membrane protein